MRVHGDHHTQQQQAVEELRLLLDDMQRISDLIWRLSVLYMPAWQDMTAAIRSAKHAMYIIDDTGNPGQNRLGV